MHMPALHIPVQRQLQAHEIRRSIRADIAFAMLDIHILHDPAAAETRSNVKKLSSDVRLNIYCPTRVSLFALFDIRARAK